MSSSGQDVSAEAACETVHKASPRKRPGCDCPVKAIREDDLSAAQQPVRALERRAEPAFDVPGICRPLLLLRVIMNCRASCELGELDREPCKHALTERPSADQLWRGIATQSKAS
jgi:hypothetical protein